MNSDQEMIFQQHSLGDLANEVERTATQTAYLKTIEICKNLSKNAPNKYIADKIYEAVLEILLLEKEVRI